ncbi:hypothetical protein [Brevibacillus parabrevis]|uniref:hypothetical protein n=1 Tax=Brevibacillus parabrevis TaxID=54914 RepID=UPI002E228A6D|nr:hypothetical protein [Brevibacillus parabrevis]
MKKLIGVVSSFIFTMILCGNSYADFPENLEIKPIISSESQIKLDWNEVGESYQVFSNGNLIYEGENSSFKHDNLVDSMPYYYVIKALDAEGKVIDQVNVKTMTRPKEKNELLSGLSKSTLEKVKQNPLTDLQVDTITNNKMVVIDWPDIDGVENYKVYRDEKFLQETTDSRVVDEEVKAGEQYTYKIVGARPMSDALKRDKIQEMKNSGIDAASMNKQDDFYQTMTIIREVDLSEEQFIAEPVPAPKKWQLRYRTFIPENFVPNPWPDSTYTYFGGDGSDRGFDAEDRRYRTHTEVRVCIFCSSNGTGATVGVTNIDVHPTKGYDANHNLVNTATASDKNIKFKYEPIVDQKNGKVEFIFEHAAPNGLVPGPDIDYYYRGKFWGAGGYTIDGGNDLAPSHEFFIIQPGNNQWVLKYGTAHKDFNMLFPPLDSFFNIGK